MEKTEVKSKKSFWYCLMTSLALGMIFFLASYIMHLRNSHYTMVDGLAGSLFVFFLAMIVALSIIPPLFNKAG